MEHDEAAAGDPGTAPETDPAEEVIEASLAEQDDDGSGEYIREPAKLMRIASMARAMLHEAREAPADTAGRELLKDIYQRTMDELCSVLSDELREELEHMFVPLEAETPTGGELRIVQAQLVGWLEGLFNGIQAAVMSQQLAAQAQFQHMKDRRALEPQQPRPGQYL